MEDIRIYGKPSSSTIALTATYQGSNSRWTGWTICINYEDLEEFACDVRGFDLSAVHAGCCFEAQISQSNWEFWCAADDAARN